MKRVDNTNKKQIETLTKGFNDLNEILREILE